MYSLTKEQKIANLLETKKNLENKISILQNQLYGVNQKIERLYSTQSNNTRSSTGLNQSYLDRTLQEASGDFTLPEINSSQY